MVTINIVVAKIKPFYDPGCIAIIDRLLRRTPVRSYRLSAYSTLTLFSIIL